MTSPGAATGVLSRRAGILIPLFSCPSSAGWGIGEIADIVPMARWLAGAGQRLLQLLPIQEMPPGETSPYSALSAMAIDPQFLSLRHVEDFAAIGGEAALEPELRRRLDAARAAPRVEYEEVRSLKLVALGRAFAHFQATEWERGGQRAAAFRAFVGDQAWWLEEYALYRAIHASQGERSWLDWPAALRDRQPEALATARVALADEILFRQYLQWMAARQWAAARAEAGEVALFGDLPFMVNRDSADVWARQGQFRMDASVGVPPDAFSDTGQDWGLPLYRWDVLAERDFDWLRDRARRYADLYDGYRIDHLVGFYRTYFRPHDGGPAQFTPAHEAEQVALGERILAVFREAGAAVTAEDLGVIPGFVHASLERLGIPGYKVFRWEREWNVEGQPFRDPVTFPACAVATSGTHDTEPMVIWWEGAPREERQAVLEIPSVRARLSDANRGHALDVAMGLPPPSRSAIHDALLEVLYASGADLLILPMQDVFGWGHRINRPATVSADNWTWRMPWPVDRLATQPEAVAAAGRLREWARRYGR